MKEFSFTDCVEIKELTGQRADDEARLMELIEDAPDDAIYYHTHSYFLRHFYIVGPYHNDFANWAAIQVRDKVLGEKLSSITPSSHSSIEDIRNALIEVIDDHLNAIKRIPAVIYGQPFHLMKSHIIEVPIQLSARSLREFRDALSVVDASAIYNHIFEARLRIKRGRSDFATWIEDVLRLKDLADRIEKIDAYMYSLEGLRGKILSLCDQALAEGEK